MPSHVKHWVTVPFHKVGTGIARWKSVSGRHALQGNVVYVCTDMSMVVTEQYLEEEEH